TSRFLRGGSKGAIPGQSWHSCQNNRRPADQRNCFARMRCPMHIPYPERIPYAWATTFATSLFIVQIFEQTQVMFALCSFAFILTATAAFNIAGGLDRPVGAYIFFNATLTAVVGLVVKACTGEAATTNLINPQRTIEVYLFGML